MGKEKHYYEILGVHEGATAGDISEAYHKRALKWKEAERGFENLTTAYKVLGDPLRRPFYDMHLRAEEKLMGKGNVPPPAACSRGSTGVALGTGRTGAALSREVAGIGSRKNTDRAGGGAKRAGLRSSTGESGGSNAKRPRGPADDSTCAAGAGVGGATGARASSTFFFTGHSTFETFFSTGHSTFETFFSTGHSTFETAVEYMNEYYDEEENRSSSDGERFCPTDHSTFKTAVKTMNEYYDEDENVGLSVVEDGAEEEGVQDAKDDGGGGDDNYDDHAGAGFDDAGIVGGGDDYYAGGYDDGYGYDDGGDGADGGFDDGYGYDDGGDGADDWW